MNKAILISAITILGAAPVMAQDVDKANGGEKTHTVKKGDTLWDISEEFLKDPFKWPEIWDKNGQIKNPHLIYPGQVIIIKPAGAGKAEAAPAPAKAEEVKEVVKEAPKPTGEASPQQVEKPVAKPEAPAKPVYYYPGIEKTGFITPDGIASSGTIVDSREDKVMLSTDDVVFIKFQGGNEIKKGDRYTIVKDATPVYHPADIKKLIGHRVDIIGVLEIVKAQDKVYEARIRESYDVISKGDKLSAIEKIPNKVEVKRGKAGVEGIVVANGTGSVETASGAIVFIDKGRNAEIEVGNIFIISIDGRITDGVSIPAEDVGRLLVLRTQDDMSTALVIDSTKPFHVGDKVRMAQ